MRDKLLLISRDKTLPKYQYVTLSTKKEQLNLSKWCRSPGDNLHHATAINEAPPAVNDRTTPTS